MFNLKVMYIFILLDLFDFCLSSFYRQCYKTALKPQNFLRYLLMDQKI
jgi:hypothetical protein